MRALQIDPAASWLPATRPVVISGPCSAESEEQTVSTALQLAASGKVHIFRAGIWKPRTRPGHFEGAGNAGLEWLIKARTESGLPVVTEVANAAHVEACLAHGVDMVWIGARTSVNPFSVQEIADALRGSDVGVFVKNPVNPDLELWIGALERVNRAGIRKLCAIHRGFSSFDRGPFRNPPMWDIAIELMTMVPGLPILCDPSHIAGGRELIPRIAQKALDLDMDGLMVESHCDPESALSDAKQQLHPDALARMLGELIVRTPSGDNNLEAALGLLREQIDRIDAEILQKIAARMKISERIGAYKRDHNVTILQVERWEEILRTRGAQGHAAGLDEQFLHDMLRLIHNESIQVQTRVMNPASDPV
ncbi:MAG: chorismate mutase [Thermoanaerobaculia bacterium]